MEKAGVKESIMETFISFYIYSCRIHVFRKTIDEIGDPKYIRFLVRDEGPSLIMEAYHKKDFQSHRVSPKGSAKHGMEISSMPLCMLLKNRLGWDPDKSYRVPGKTYPSQHMAVFDLSAAKEISNTEGDDAK